MSEDKLTTEQLRVREEYNIYKNGKCYANIDRYVELNFNDMSITDMAKNIGVGRVVINNAMKRLGVTKYEIFEGLRLGEEKADLGHYEEPWCNYFITSYGRLVHKETLKVRKYKKRQGYCRYEIKYNGTYPSKSQHRLIAENFIPNPNNKPYINHIDGVRDNNSIDNLEWVTHKENLAHARDILKRDGMYGEGSNLAKLSEYQAIELIKLINKGLQYSEIKYELPFVTDSMIKNMKFNNVWSSLEHFKEWDKDTFKNRKRSLTDKDVKVARYLYEHKSVSVTNIAKLLDTDNGTISNVVAKKAYKDVEDL